MRLLPPKAAPDPDGTFVLDATLAAVSDVEPTTDVTEQAPPPEETEE